MNTNSEYYYFGTYTRSTSQGIYQARLHNGALEDISLLSAIENPTYLALDHQHNRLISVGQFETAAGLAVIDLSDNKKGQIQSTLSYSKHVPCYVSYDAEKGLVYTANYHDAILAVLSLSEDGQLHLLDQVHHEGSGPHPNQASAHIHFACPHPFTEGLLTCDLGSDLISHYRLNSAKKLVKVNDLQITPGSGPRHLAFHPSQPVAYLLSELTSEVTVLPFDSQKQCFRLGASYSLLPDDFQGQNSGAAIRLSRDGHFLYASNRGHNSIVVFTIAEDGQSLHLIQRLSSGDDFPRDFNLSTDGHWLICGHQKGLTRIFSRDPHSGKLALKDPIYTIPECVCVLPSGPAH